jgi:hypothetical protein
LPTGGSGGLEFALAPVVAVVSFHGSEKKFTDKPRVSKVLNYTSTGKFIPAIEVYMTLGEPQKARNIYFHGD